MIAYALVAKGKVVLAEYSDKTGNFASIARIILSKIGSNDAKMSYPYDSYSFHYVVRNGVTFMCMTELNSKRRIPFLFLEEIIKIFENECLEKKRREKFSNELQSQMLFFNNDPSADSVNQVKSQLDDVTEIAYGNIEKILDRGEKLEILVDKTDRLNLQATKFEESSQRMKRAMWLRKMKLTILLLLLSLLAVYAGMAMVCGLKLNC